MGGGKWGGGGGGGGGLSMLRSFGKIGPQIDQIWAWLSRGHRWSPGVRNPLKSSITGPSLLVNCYLKIKFHKIIRVNPPPPPPLKWEFEPIIEDEQHSPLYQNTRLQLNDTIKSANVSWDTELLKEIFNNELTWLLYQNMYYSSWIQDF